MSAPLPLSVVVVAKNEAHNLPRCLGSVRGWVAEIVVVLNDTKDDSEAIAQSFGGTVHHLPWLGYRDTKNAALDLAAQPWVLSLDADEEVSPALHAALTAFFARPDFDKFAGARFPRKVWFIDRWITHGDWYPDYSLRLLHRPHARWGGDAFVHEKVECTGPVATLRGDLLHHSFPTLASHVAKINPFADLFVRQQKARHARFSLLSAIVRPFWRFFRAYIVKLGFLDGFPGFYIAWATAFGAFVRYSRLYESERHRPPDRAMSDEPPSLSHLAEELVGELRGVPFWESRRTKKRPTLPLTALVEQLMVQHQIGRPSPEQSIRDNWVAIVGVANAQHSHAARIERNRLLVLAAHSVVRNELFHHREEIARRIRALPGCEHVKSLNLRAG